MPKGKVCECCGHPLPSYHALLGLTRGQQRIFEIVEKAGRAGVEYRNLFDRLYAEDPDGGPDSTNVLAVQRAKMNLRLADHGLIIRTSRSPYGVWRLGQLSETERTHAQA